MLSYVQSTRKLDLSFFAYNKLPVVFNFRLVEQLQQKKLAHFTLFYCLYFGSKLGMWWHGTGWFKKPENTVPFVMWNTRNFKPELFLDWKAPNNNKAARKIIFENVNRLRSIQIPSKRLKRTQGHR